MLLADNGFDNYQHHDLPRRKTGRREADVVQRFVDASPRAGRATSTAIRAPANALIKKDNPDMTDDKIAYAIKVMNETRHRRLRRRR